MEEIIQKYAIGLVTGLTLNNSLLLIEEIIQKCAIGLVTGANSE
jgi:hypothetical protein